MSNPRQITHDSRSSSTKTDFTRRDMLAAGSAATAGLLLSPAVFSQEIKLQRVPTQYIAALGDPNAKSGNNAEQWGLWELDPGPRGVRLNNYEKMKNNGGVAPAQWVFDNEDWWLEEHGLIMEAPVFPIKAGYYYVTGDREAEAILTVQPMAEDGTQAWALSDDVSIYDVTHLRCRSGRYTPAAGEGSCTPANASQRDFPVTPGADMPDVSGCNRVDYAVLIVIAIASFDAVSNTG